MNILKTIHKILKTPYWPETIQTNQPYTTTHDDNDGDKNQQLKIYFTPDGDAWITTTTHLRYRNPLGGGKYHRTYNALKILAEAIRLDNQEQTH